jgi:uncharacterized protein (DUF302 family)
MNRLPVLLDMTTTSSTAVFGQPSPAGLITYASKHSFAETLARLETAVVSNGEYKVLYNVDHAAGAASVGQPIRPMVLFLIVNPRSGAALQAVAPTIGIDLPIRVLVWEGEAGRVFVTMNSAAWLLGRHGLSNQSEAVKKLGSTFDALGRTATE